MNCKLERYLIVACLFLAASSLMSQIALNGTAAKFDFAGSQPELVKGVSVAQPTGAPLVRHVYMASPEVIGILIDSQTCLLPKLVPYLPQEGDRIEAAGYHGLNRLLVRNGVKIGYIAGREENWFRPFNEDAGERLDVEWAADTGSFLVTSDDDNGYSAGQIPLAVYRKSRPNENVTRLRPIREYAMTHRHYLFLKMPAPLKDGSHYRIQFRNYDGDFQKEVSFHYSSGQLRSESVHVNLYGYAPESPKFGQLSMWLGDGGALDFPKGLQFRIVNREGGETVFSGPVTLRQSADEPEYVVDGQAFNQNNTHVYEMDFSRLSSPGNYKLVVEGIGCSFDFLIDDEVWENTARLMMKGFFHQRAGIETGPPYTDYIRPRNMHPEDGHVVHRCDPEKYFSAPEGHFGPIQASIQEDTEIPEAWGGWMDAGDFDRRMTHLYTVRRMMYLYELNPEYFAGLDFNIPESGNSNPDILDEALWCLDLFRRTQGVYEEGAVSWQVESIEHPRHGETSWLNSLPTALLPPSREAAWEYVATAANMARVLRKCEAALAATYESSALAAMKWLESNPDAHVITRDRKEIQVLAYLNLYRLTDDTHWHQQFRESLKELYPDGLYMHLEYKKIDAVAIYGLMEPSKTDPELRNACRKAVVAFADALLDGADESTYHLLRLKTHPLTRLVPMKYKVLPLIAAHRMTGEDTYTDALARAVQYTMGLNPMNKSYICGLGERYFRPYHHDWHADDLPLPAGLPNFGPVIMGSYTGDSINHPISEGLIAPFGPYYRLYPPELPEWPMPEACFDQMWVYVQNEFMVETPMGELLFLSGYLAAE